MRRLIVCALLFSVLVAGCATTRPACPTEPPTVNINMDLVQNGKTKGYFLTSPNFEKILDSLKKQKAYQDSLKKAAINGGCQG